MNTHHSSVRPARQRLSQCLAAAWLAFGLPAAAQIHIGAGSVVQLGAATTQLGCADVQVDGQLSIDQGTYEGVNNLGIGAAGVLNGGSGVLSLSGNFANAGSFNAGTGEVRSVDGCGATRSSITGTNTFHHLLVSTTTGRTIALQAGFTQTVQAALTLTGAPDNLLQVRSTVLGSAAVVNLQPDATQTVRHVDVADQNAIGQVIGQGTQVSFNSIMGSNVSRWFVPTAAVGGSVTPVPTLGDWGLVLLAMLTMGSAVGSMRKRH